MKKGICHFDFKVSIVNMQSPCIRICILNSQQYCIGCKRHINEISQWSTMPGDIQYNIVQELGERNIDEIKDDTNNYSDSSSHSSGLEGIQTT